MRRAITFALALSVLSLYGCGGGLTADDLAGRVYTYEGEGFGGDFTIALGEDGSFSYYEGMLSSYIGSGEWSFDGERLRLADVGMQDRVRELSFDAYGDVLTYVADESDGFIYVDLPDGARFTSDWCKPD